MVRLKGKGKRDEADDTPNTKQSKSIPSSSNPFKVLQNQMKKDCQDSIMM